MCSLNDLCCICLEDDKKLYSLNGSEKDDVSYYTKIIASLPEMNIEGLTDAHKICVECCDDLNVAYVFRKKCFKTKPLLSRCVKKNVDSKVDSDEVNCKEKSETKSEVRIEECCVCLQNKRSLKNLSETNDVSFCMKINSCVPEMNFQMTDNKKICIKCCKELTTSYLFREKCLKNKSTLLNYIADAENLVYIKTENPSGTEIQSNKTSEKKNFSNDSSGPSREIIMDGVKNSENTKTIDLSLESKDEEVENITDEPDDPEENTLKYTKRDQNEYKSINSDECEDTNEDTEDMTVEYDHSEENEALLPNPGEDDQFDRERIYHAVFQKDPDSDEDDESSDSDKEPKSKKSESSKTHECHICNKLFTNSSNRKRHMRLHTGEIKYKCKACPEIFSSFQDLITHRKIHVEVKTYTCEICNKVLKSYWNLEQHIRIHTGERPFECSVCNKTFSQEASLWQHNKIHLGVKPYECIVCNKKFIRTTHLNQHMQTHTGAKPFECEKCHKKYTRASVLARHVILVHIEKENKANKT